MTFPFRFPDPIPSGTRVPHWAYLPIEVCPPFLSSRNPFQRNLPSQTIFGTLPLHEPLSVNTIIRILSESTSDPILAPAGPESTPTTGPTSFTGYTSTTNYGGTFTTVIPGGNTGGGGGGSPKSKPTNVGAIVGGVVGGVVGLALVALLGIFLFRRRNSNQVAPSSTYTSQYPGPTPLVEEKSNLGYNVTGSTMVTPSPSLGGPMRLYVRITCFFLGLFLKAGFTDLGSCRIRPILPLSLWPMTVLLGPGIYADILADRKFEVVVNLGQIYLDLDPTVFKIPKYYLLPLRIFSKMELSIPIVKLVPSRNLLPSCAHKFNLGRGKSMSGGCETHLGSATRAGAEVQLRYPSWYGLARPRRRGVPKLLDELRVSLDPRIFWHSRG